MSNVKEVKYRIKKDCEAAAKWRIVFDLRFPRYYLLPEVNAMPKPFNRHNNVSEIQTLYSHNMMFILNPNKVRTQKARSPSVFVVNDEGCNYARHPTETRQYCDYDD